MANFSVKFGLISMAAIALLSSGSALAADGTEKAASVSRCASSTTLRHSPSQAANVATGAESLPHLYFLPTPLGASDAAPVGLVVPLTAEAIDRMDADELQMRIAATEKLIADLTAQMPPATDHQATDCAE